MVTVTICCPYCSSEDLVQDGHASICRKTRQVVARAIGDRSEKTCCELWNNISDEYRKEHCFSGFWHAYQAVIPEDQLTQVGK